MMTLEEPVVEALTTRFASIADLGSVTNAFLTMLQELAPLGHDVRPSRHNAVLYGTSIFGPALRSGQHGIVLCFRNDELIGCVFCVHESSAVETAPLKRAINHGLWVAPEHRRQGIALMLQDMAHARLTALGCTSLLSTVLRDNEAGLAAARKAGAEIVGYVTSVALKGEA